MAGAVLPEHRPTLGDLLTPRVGVHGVRVLGVLALLAVVLVVASRLRGGRDGTVLLWRTGPVPFRLVYTEGLERVPPQGRELLRLEARRGALFVQSFAVEPFRLAPYRGEIGGALPVMAVREIDALRRRFAAFELVQDGKARVNDVSGYTILFRARLGKRRLYGREVLLPEAVAGTRRGVRLFMLATPAGGVSNAAEVGVRGIVKRPYRTFRFGTDL